MTSPAEAYDRHVGRYGAQLAAGLMSTAGVHPGQRALDVGYGPGAVTSALADSLGAASVAAVDPSEPFAEACRLRVPGADVRVAVGEELPFPDDDGRRVGYDSPDELGGLFKACGLGNVATGELLVGADYESFDALWRPFAAGVGHSGGCCASLDTARRTLLRSDVHRRLGSPEGSSRLTARAWWARGTVS